MSEFNVQESDKPDVTMAELDMPVSSTAKSDMPESSVPKLDKSKSSIPDADMPGSDVAKPDRTIVQPAKAPPPWNYYHRTDNWMSERFVESAGCILFHLSTQQICIIRSRQNGEYLLPKGRCNLGECRQDTALRETQEETGYAAYLLPVTMHTRNSPLIETPSSGEDKPRLFENICEPITMQLRYLGTAGVKVIWWFVAAIDEAIEPCQDPSDKEMYEPVLFGYNEVLRRLTWPNDREIVCRALDLVKHQAHMDDLSRVVLKRSSGHDGGGEAVGEGGLI